MKRTEVNALARIRASIQSGNYEAAMDVLIAASPKPETYISGPSSMHALLKPFALKRQEYFIVILLNGAHRVIGEPLVISKGLMNRTMVHPREVFRPAIEANAAAIIIAHNHPSGDTKPSLEDKDLTERLVKASEIIGIPILDHIIIGKGDFFSFKECSLID